jgi:uncharacterized protein YjeT (DUF2065 family)
MMPLSTAAYLLGGVIMALHLPALLAPGWLRVQLRALPRGRIPARLFTGAALFWVAWIVFHAPLGRFDAYKPALFVLTPLAFFLITHFLDELLAPRALGGLLLLAANPLLNLARWHDSPLRLVVTVICYLAVVAGIILVLSPYRFRHAAEFGLRTDARGRWGGAAGVAIGLVLLWLGLNVY